MRNSALICYINLPVLIFLQSTVVPISGPKLLDVKMLCCTNTCNLFKLLQQYRDKSIIFKTTIVQTKLYYEHRSFDMILCFNIDWYYCYCLNCDILNLKTYCMQMISICLNARHFPPAAQYNMIIEM